MGNAVMDVVDGTLIRVSSTADDVLGERREFLVDHVAEDADGRLSIGRQVLLPRLAGSLHLAKGSHALDWMKEFGLALVAHQLNEVSAGCMEGGY